MKNNFKKGDLIRWVGVPYGKNDPWIGLATEDSTGNTTPVLWIRHSQKQKDFPITIYLNECLEIHRPKPEGTK